MAMGPKKVVFAGAEKVDSEIGERVFNTTMKFSSVINRKINLNRIKRQSNIEYETAENPWTNPERHILELGQPYDRSYIEQLQSEFKAALAESDKKREITHDGETYAEQLCSYSLDNPKFDFPDSLPLARDILNREVLSKIKMYYRTDFIPDFFKIYRNYHIPEEVIEETEIYSNYWHCDSYAVDGLKLFVNLNDVTEDHGPFHIISREDTKQFVGSGYDRRKHGIPNDTVERRADVIKATGQAGTAMLANTNLCLHRADNPAEGNHRDLLMINFLPSDEPMRDDWLESYPLDRKLGRANN